MTVAEDAEEQVVFCMPAYCTRNEVSIPSLDVECLLV
jgi:hypothetical protein